MKKNAEVGKIRSSGIFDTRSLMSLHYSLFTIHYSLEIHLSLEYVC
jgi:hypothetical protein